MPKKVQLSAVLIDFLRKAPPQLNVVADRETVATWIRAIIGIEKLMTKLIKSARAGVRARNELTKLRTASLYALELLDQFAQGDQYDTFKDGFAELLGIKEPEELEPRRELQGTDAPPSL